MQILLEKDDAKKKGWVWDDNSWRRVISYTWLKITSKQDPNKYTDKCEVVLREVENDNSSSIFKKVYDYNGDYFNSYKIYKKQLEVEEKKDCIGEECDGNCNADD